MMTWCYFSRHNILKTTVGTHPICYQKAILSEDLTCSIENTLGKLATHTKKQTETGIGSFEQFSDSASWMKSCSTTIIVFHHSCFIVFRFTRPTCAVLKELYCSKLMATITSQELRGMPAHFSHGSLASRWTGWRIVFAWVAAMYALILLTEVMQTVILYFCFKFSSIILTVWVGKCTTCCPWSLMSLMHKRQHYPKSFSCRHKPVPRLLFDVWWLPGDKCHLLGKSYYMLPSSRAQLQGEQLPVGLVLQHIFKHRTQTLPVPLCLWRQQHGLKQRSRRTCHSLLVSAARLCTDFLPQTLYLHLCWVTEVSWELARQRRRLDVGDDRNSRWLQRLPG